VFLASLCAKSTSHSYEIDRTFDAVVLCAAQNLKRGEKPRIWALRNWFLATLGARSSARTPRNNLQKDCARYRWVSGRRCRRYCAVAGGNRFGKGSTPNIGTSDRYVNSLTIGGIVGGGPGGIRSLKGL
jgi:hypothetical protein